MRPPERFGADLRRVGDLFTQSGFRVFSLDVHATSKTVPFLLARGTNSVQWLVSGGSCLRLAQIGVCTV